MTKTFIRKQRGDTLIEVTIALAILSLTLMGATRLAIRAFQQAQTARERTTVALAAQQQIEHLRTFRDTHTWTEFLYGDASGTGFKGVLSTYTAGCRKEASGCFNMDKVGNNFYPVGGIVQASVPDSYIEIMASPDNGADPKLIKFTVSWGFRDLSGGPENVNHVVTQLARLTAVIPTPAAAVPCSNNMDVFFVLDASESMRWDWYTDWVYPAPALNRLQAMINLLNGPSGFLNNVGIGAGNQGGIVIFNDPTPELAQTLTTNVATLTSKVNAQSDFSTAFNTRYIPSLRLAKNQLLSGPGARAGAQKAIVLISDGFPDDYREVDPGSDYTYYAQNYNYVKNFIDSEIASPATNVGVYTIGIQANVADNQVLHYIAQKTTGSAGNYHAVNTEAEFQSALEALAGLLGC